MPQKTQNNSSSIHRKIQISDVRKCTTRIEVGHDDTPEEKSGAVITHFASEKVLESEAIQNAISEVTGGTVEEPVTAPVIMPVASASRPHITAKQIKEQEIERAMRSAERIKSARSRRKIRRYPPTEFGLKRVALAMATAAVVVFGVVYLVNANTPDISMKVAAMQNGIDAVYPAYTPRGFALSDITSENGKVTLNFKNPETGAAYSLTEEAVSENVTLLEYIDETFGANYTRIDEQGISVYISNNGAAWTNNGVVFKLKITSGSLTRKQITTIATTQK